MKDENVVGIGGGSLGRNSSVLLEDPQVVGDTLGAGWREMRKWGGGNSESVSQ